MNISNAQKTKVLIIDSFFSFDDQEMPFRDSISEMLSKIRADPKSAYDCNLCKVQCSSQDTLATHMQGKQHKRNVEKNNALSFGGGSAFRQDFCSRKFILGLVVILTDISKRRPKMA